MTTRILFAASSESWENYAQVLPAALEAAGVDHEILQLSDAPDPATVDWVIYAPSSPLQDFTPYTRLKGVLNLWAGVENVEGNRTLTAPLARMVDPDLTQGMVEWVTGHVLRHHLGMDAHIHGAPWDPTPPPLTRDRPVAMLGMGVLGTACAKALRDLGFPVTGWSRSVKDVPGVRSLTDEDGLRVALEGADIVVLLTPHTRSTENLMNAERLSLMRDGAVLLNPGRGALIDDAALLAALPRLGHATLDAFRVEPLPEDAPYWSHPKVTVTPHIASTTRPASAARTLAENIRRGEAGEPLLHLVDRSEALA
ncbi:2-hydroxyacid dehydrogenase [Jannaschia seohaensis]|uniref:Glyoxylate/hydroxypyruvate reductase A n=1 Tax=Jannaschia seohaensis TaxID=475081 RepID=A0A2Y9A3W8_9RHOB|nr:glyoxylate/hydroxypyruvate reductase A [Jannaschia seohaensis]PWJ22288.1 glyoxylate/hydroxypyruvate reductase A [Jannaschia seohaensis]SSA38566.1 glyoxylate/hydroxypyruvate reductase A [Jannaschia seohaensis]